MLTEPAVDRRHAKTVSHQADLIVVGGGLAGTCCAITAARAGIRVVLVQDRPVLGGNASSEVRLWVLGATAHMNSPNRWAREGGVVDEILIENMYRNPEGNATVFDTLLLEKVTSEPNITLLLNTAAFEVKKSGDLIKSVRAFCSQNSTFYDLSAPLFCDASGDGIMAFLAGAAFRMGAEKREEFGEKFAPSKEYGELLGHSIYFYSKDIGKPVRFVPPAFALKNVEGAIPRFRNFNTKTYGCRLWWIEFGGRLDTVHDTETIKWELWKVVYGVWDYIKNSGNFPDAANLTLEWVGTIPGKRESRRFEGDYIMTQLDVIEQRQHPDDVAFGGWSIDLHPADGVFSERPGCNQWFTKGPYPIPYRSMYSRNVSNLFLAGRVMSASHVAFGSTRVMATTAHCGQAVGMAAAVCQERGLLPRQASHAPHITDIQQRLHRTGQYVPFQRIPDATDLARRATITASSTLKLDELPFDGEFHPLARHLTQMLPMQPGKMPVIEIELQATQPTSINVSLQKSLLAFNHAPEATLAEQQVRLASTEPTRVKLDFSNVHIDQTQYVYLRFEATTHVSVRVTTARRTGLLRLHRHKIQQPDTDIGVETFDIMAAERRPGGHNIAFRLDRALTPYAPEHVTNGIDRPTVAPNAWSADPTDAKPTLQLKWEHPVTIAEVDLQFDPDFDHPAESVLMGHPETVMPFCVKSYRLVDDAGNVIHECADNHHGLQRIRLATPVTTTRLRIECGPTHGGFPSSLFAVRCYPPTSSTGVSA
jgi:FAD dependent oxidoreductase